MHKPTDYLEARRVLVEKVQLQLQHRYREQLPNPIEADIHSGFLAEEVIATFATHIAGVGGETVEIDRHFPRTWWDHTKLRFFPQWLLRKFPPNMEHVYVHRKFYNAVCPHISLPADDDAHLAFLAVNQSED